MKKLFSLLVALNLPCFISFSQAENLLQVYQQARKSNPELRKSAAERDAAFEKINQARSPLLPQLGISSGYNYSHGFRGSKGVNSGSTSGSLTVTQVLFDLSKWSTLTLQEKQASIQDVALQSSEQSLMLQTATAYFQVLRTIDALSTIEAQKKAVYRQLDQTTQRFNVGLVAITDVQNARANFDSVLASEVTASNNLDNALESLRQVSGKYYPELASLNIRHFITHSPRAVSSLLQQAEEHNLTLFSARLSQDLAREQIKLAQTGHLPVIGLTASSGLTDTRYNGLQTGFRTPFDDNDTGQHQVGVSLTLPLYSGGATHSQVKQAQYNFVAASEQLESAYRSVVQTVRSSINNVSASASSVEAYKQVVVSAQSSLDATEAGYQAGTRTIVDVLTATTTLYDAKQKLSNARYDYLIHQLNIQSALGELSENDLLALNGKLDKPVSTSATSIAVDQQKRTTTVSPAIAPATPHTSASNAKEVNQQ